MKRKFFCTSEYLESLCLLGGAYICKDRDFRLFSSFVAANADAQWLVDHYAKHGKKIKKPVIYRVRLEKVKK